jgi:hypothetical protein
VVVGGAIVRGVVVEDAVFGARICETFFFGPATLAARAFFFGAGSCLCALAGVFGLSDPGALAEASASWAASHCAFLANFSAAFCSGVSIGPWPVSIVLSGRSMINIEVKTHRIEGSEFVPPPIRH